MDDEPHTRSRNWPRDAPIRWGAFFGGLGFQLVVVVGVAAHLVIGALSIWAIAGDAVDGAGEWLLAIGWGGLALWQFRAWWFQRRAVALAPILAAALLAVLGGWPG